MAGHCEDTARSASAAVLTSPDHLWSIFSALPAKYLVTACRVCRQWRDVERENEEALWRPLCSQLALLRGAKHMQAQRVECASHQQAAAKAEARRRLLERSLRAALRPSGLAAANIPPAHR